MTSYMNPASNLKITRTDFNEVTRTQGRVDNVGLYPLNGLKYIVTKIGSYYYVLDGWDTSKVYGGSGIAAHTCWNWAITHLTAGREKVETILGLGDFILTDYIGPFPTGKVKLVLDGSVTQTSNLAKNCLISSAIVEDVEICGGKWIGNMVGQPVGPPYSSGLMLSNITRLHVHDIESTNQKYFAVAVLSCYDAELHRIYGHDQGADVLAISTGDRANVSSIYGKDITSVWEPGGAVVWINQPNVNMVNIRGVNMPQVLNIEAYNQSNHTINVSQVIGYDPLYDVVKLHAEPTFELCDVHIRGAEAYDPLRNGARFSTTGDGLLHDFSLTDFTFKRAANYGVQLSTATVGNIYKGTIGDGFIEDSVFSNVSGSGIKRVTFRDLDLRNGLSAGMTFGNSTYCKIHHNKIYDDQLVHTQTIGISESAGCDWNDIRFNELLDQLSSCAVITGENTTLEFVPLYIVSATEMADSGALIDHAGDMATFQGWLPNGLQEAMRIKVGARAGVLEADGMMLSLAAYAGAEKEVYTTESIAKVKASKSLNFAANENIYWQFTVADDADVRHLKGRDMIEFKLLYNIADGANCATNAWIRSIILEYV